MLITNFASGELSPNLNGRVDIRQYYQGAARIENFEIIPTGGIKRRPGTQRLAQLSDNSRIIPFIVDKNSVYILELALNPDYDAQTPGSTKTILNVWKKGVLGSYSVVTTLGLPYGNLADARAIQYAQNYDTIVFTHNNYTPYVIEVTGNSFSGQVMEFDFTPDVEIDDDFDYIMVVAPGTNKPTKETTADGHGRFTYNKLINGTSTLFTKDFNEGINDFYCVKDGKMYKWENAAWADYGTDPEIDTNLFTTATKYPACCSFFNNRLYFAATSAKPQMVWGSNAPDNSGVKYGKKSYFSTYRKYVTVNKVVKNADLHLFTCDLAYSDIDTTNHRTTFKNVTQDFTISGKLAASITSYFVSSDILPIGTKVLSVTSNTITVDTDQVAVVWDEEETEKTNFTMSIQLWRDVSSVSAEDYEYMVVANNITTADCSLFFELASDQNDAIKFLSSNRFLAVGTESSIWSIDPGISALSVNAVMQGRYGSDDIQGQAVETATVYFAQGKKGIREFYYDGESSAFRTNNIALLADHILRESAVIDFDYMTNPYSRLLMVRANGTMAEMLYDKTNGIMAWSRFTMTNGKIKNCAVTRGEDENDLVFLVVQDGEDENQNPLYYLEMLDLGSEVYLDSWSDYTGLTTGYTDGAILYNKTTGEKCEDLENIPDSFVHEGDTVYIGYTFTSKIKSMPIIGNDPSKRLRISALLVRFLDSFKPVAKITDLPNEKFNTIENVPYSGIAKMNYPGTTDHDVCFEIEAADVDPVNILSVDAQTA